MPRLALLDGKTLTMDERSRVAEALAIRDGKILAVGITFMIRTITGRQARVIDLGGKTAGRAPELAERSRILRYFPQHI